MRRWVTYAIRLMLGIERGKANTISPKGDIKDYFRLGRAFRKMMARTDCKPWFVGVWDTVSSIGWVANPLKLPYVTNNPDIAIGRQAIAIDERRAFFRSHLWSRPDDPSQEHGPKDLMQVWFPGVHCDVGGGYAESESGLAKGALEWMLDEAEKAQLIVDPERRREILGQTGANGYAPPDANGVLHESLTGAWNIAEFVPKKRFDWQSQTEEWRINFYRRRTIPARSLVHVSAFERGAEYCKRLPSDTVKVDRKASRRNV